MPNNLINESSPYLLQHANNPVEWYPWGNEALSKAESENKPIFVSIGYSSCHWCHVMEKESFENESIAKILNENFVSIKIDREERPDIDKYFQEVYSLMNGRGGGWPTSIFLTPDQKPFYSATYIPSTSKYGMMAFDELLTLIAQRYKKDEKLLKEKGIEVLEFLNPKNRKIEATKLDIGVIDKFIAQAKSLYNKKFGGFGGIPKFPQASTYLTLMDMYRFKRDNEILDMIDHSLKAMTCGGFYDKIDGGFCRYSTDEKWLIPHFEKMTYDNALLSELYLKAFILTNNEYYKKIALDTIDFMLGFMYDGRLFYSASDADSKGGEGEYFTYDYNETIAAFKNEGIENAVEIANKLGITKEGNFEERSIVNFNYLDSKEYDKALKILQDLRKKREYPFIDKKIIVSWNAMMISSLFLAGMIEEKYLENAKDSLAELIKMLYVENNLFHSTINGQKPKIEAFLEDYAYLALALLIGYDATLDKNYLDFAVILANEAIKKFYIGFEWNFSNTKFATKADIYDTSYPSSLAVILDVLLRLDALTDLDYSEIIFKSIEVHSHSIMRQPISSPYMANNVAKYLKKFLVLKSSIDNLFNHKNEIIKLNYPYLLLNADDNNDWSLCTKGSCFAHANNFNEISVELDKLN